MGQTCFESRLQKNRLRTAHQNEIMAGDMAEPCRPPFKLGSILRSGLCCGVICARNDLTQLRDLVRRNLGRLEAGAILYSDIIDSNSISGVRAECPCYLLKRNHASVK